MTTKSKAKRGLPAMHPTACRDRPPSWRVTTDLDAILTERATVTPEMALRLGKLCGNGSELWLNLQARYDFERPGKAKRAEIAGIPTLAAG
ncbi:MAG: hypothetical protein ACREFD_00115 [Stellaceae bacterium]